jgi:hypothetical protein
VCRKAWPGATSNHPIVIPIVPAPIESYAKMREYRTLGLLPQLDIMQDECTAEGVVRLPIAQQVGLTASMLQKMAAYLYVGGANFTRLTYITVQKYRSIKSFLIFCYRSNWPTQSTAPNNIFTLVQYDPAGTLDSHDSVRYARELVPIEFLTFQLIDLIKCSSPTYENVVVRRTAMLRETNVV